MRSFFASLHDDDAGFGLISALLFVLLISAAIAPLAIAGRVQVLSTAYTHERREFEILAEGLARTVFTLNAHEKAPLSWQRCETPRYVFYVDIRDQNGLIDLNSASPQLLQFGFRALGLEETDALVAARLAERYRTPGGSDGGGIDGPAVDLKHAPFEDVTELADIIGAKALSMGDPAHIFTVFNKTDTVALGHVDGHLRQIIEKSRGSEFLADGAGNSSISEVSILRFRKGRPSGFLLQAMMERTSGEGASARMLRRNVRVVDEGDTGIPRETGPCRGVTDLLIRSYDA